MKQEEERPGLPAAAETGTTAPEPADGFSSLPAGAVAEDDDRTVDLPLNPAGPSSLDDDATLELPAKTPRAPSDPYSSLPFPTAPPSPPALDSEAQPEELPAADEMVARMRRELEAAAIARDVLSPDGARKIASAPPPVAIAIPSEPEPETRRAASPVVLGAAALVVVVGLAVVGGFALAARSTGSVSAPPTPGIAQPPAVAAAPTAPIARPSATPESVTTGASVAIDPTARYAADWSQGSNGWPTSGGWSSSGAILHNDGSDFGDANWVGGAWNLRWVAAPYTLPADLTDYAVEAEIQETRRPACGSFGLVVRGAYQIGIHDCQAAAGAPFLSIRSSAPRILANAPIDGSFDPSQGWHLYRIEVRGDDIRAFVDGTEIAALADSAANQAGPVGLWDDHTEINVRAFRVREL